MKPKSSRQPGVAVLGAGSVGLALAGSLARSGVDVSLAELPRFEASLGPIVRHGGIKLRGYLGTGVAVPALISTDIRRSILGRRLIFFCSPAYGHEEFIDACAPHLGDGQILIFISCYAALRSRARLDVLGVDAAVTIAELLTCLLIARRLDENEVLLKRAKSMLPFATYPAAKTQETLEVVRELFPQLVAAANCLQTSIHNTNPFFHVPKMLLNAGWIEATQGDFSFSLDARTPAVARLQAEMDAEKNAVAHTLGLEAITSTEMASRMYHNVLSAGQFHQAEFDVGSKDAPSSLQTRYLLEDVPFGLSPLASIGNEIGVKTPLLDAVIRVSSILVQQDLTGQAVDVHTLGLAGLGPKEMMEQMS